MESGLLSAAPAALSPQLQGLEAVLAELAAGPRSPERQTEIEEALAGFKAQGDALELALDFLRETRSAYVQWYCASVIEYKLQAEWARLPLPVRAAVASHLALFLRERCANVSSSAGDEDGGDGAGDGMQLAPFARSKLLAALVGVGMADADAMLQLLQVIGGWCALPTAPPSPPPWAPPVDSAHEVDEVDSRKAQLKLNHLGLLAVRVLAEELGAKRYPGADVAKRVVESKVKPAVPRAWLAPRGGSRPGLTPVVCVAPFFVLMPPAPFLSVLPCPLPPPLSCPSCWTWWSRT